MSRVTSKRSDYKINYKRWNYHVYKTYSDGREHHLAEYLNKEAAESFIEYDIEREKERVEWLDHINNYLEKGKE